MGTEGWRHWQNHTPNKMITYKTRCHPEANDRKALKGEVEYEFTFETETGGFIKVRMGKTGYAHHTQHVLDMLSNAPSYDDGSLPKS